MTGSFFDTNVLIYLASKDAGRAERVEALLDEGGTISVQVLNEMTNVMRRKMQLSWPETTEFLALVRALLAVESLTAKTHDLGLWLAERYQLSVYDAQIVAAARLAGCDTLWSEDMQDGLVVEKALVIRNPFVVR